MPSEQSVANERGSGNFSCRKSAFWLRLRLTAVTAAAVVLVSGTPALASVHTVVPGESLWSISRLYDTTVESLQVMNNLKSDLIFPGQKLTVPEKKVTAPAPAKVATAAAPSAQSTAELSRGGSKRDIRAASLLTVAQSFLGRPYRYGAGGPNAFDCSGFTAYVFANCGHSLPHNAADQAAYGQAVARDELEPGDLVFFGYYGSKDIRHVGIYVGGNRFIHASTSGGVKYSSLAEAYYASNYKGARRL